MRALFHRAMPSTIRATPARSMAPTMKRKKTTPGSLVGGCCMYPSFDQHPLGYQVVDDRRYEDDRTGNRPGECKRNGWPKSSDDPRVDPPAIIRQERRNGTSQESNPIKQPPALCLEPPLSKGEDSLIDQGIEPPARRFIIQRPHQRPPADELHEVTQARRTPQTNT